MIKFITAASKPDHHTLIKSGVILLIASIILTMPDTLFSQSGESEGTAVYSDSVEAFPAIMRSLIIPGWGQIYQERLLEGAMLYGSSAYYYYNAFYHLYHYNKGQAEHHLQKFQSNFKFGLFFHMINIMDIADASFREKQAGWQGGLFYDKPLKSPWGAALRSAILPGWGQLYTESYLKAAGYLAVDGFLFYKIREADIRYRGTRETKYRDDRSRFSWYFGLAYLITIADAYADAYLYRFDDAVILTFSPEISGDVTGFRLHVHF